MIIIGDVAGQFDALVELTKPFLGNDKIVLVGDLIDRGPKSREVVQWCIDNEQNGVTALMGNHEHMAIDFIDFFMGHTDQMFYDRQDWIANGGGVTLRSYGGTMVDAAQAMVPHINWLRKRSLFLRSQKDGDNLYISHAPWPGEGSEGDKILQLWNREQPVEMPKTFQVFGHNSHWGLSRFRNNQGQVFAMCIDSSRSGVLTALQTPEFKLHHVEFEKKKDADAGC